MNKKPDWFYDADLSHVMSVLNTEWRETRYVGGCIRDFLLQRRDIDIDIDMATQLHPDEVISLCNDAGLKTIPTGLDHGTISVLAGERVVEVTTLRRDVETDGRRAVVAYTDCWVEDAYRRDFTVNSLSMDVNGAVHDPLGLGVDDIASRRLRFVGDPEARIKEDALRILRFFRFMDVFFNTDAASLHACTQNWGLLEGLSKERVTQEMRKMIVAIPASQGLKEMAAQGLTIKNLGLNFQFFYNIKEKSQNIDIECEPVLWVALFSGVLAEELGEALSLPRTLVKQMQAICGAVQDSDLYWSTYRHGKDVGVQAAILAGWDVDDIITLQNWEIPVCPITAEVVMRDEGLDPGPELGKRLKQLEREWFTKEVLETGPRQN